MNKKLLCALLLTSPLMVSPAHSFFGGFECGGCATERTQVANNIMLGKGLEEHARQLITFSQKLDAFKRTVAQARNLAEGGDLVKLAKESHTLMLTLDGFYRDFANAENDFMRKFPGYGSALKSQTNTTFGQRAAGLYSANRESILNVLRTTGAQVSSIENEYEMIAALTNKANSAEGEMQALQILTQLTAQMKASNMQYRQVVAASTNSQATWIAAESDRRMQQVQDKEANKAMSEAAEQRLREQRTGVAQEFSRTTGSGFKKIEIQR